MARRTLRGKLGNGAESRVPEQLRYNALSDLYRTHYLGPQEVSNGHYGGAPPELFPGDPATLRPDLYNSDGYKINDDNMSEADKKELLETYREFKNSDAWSLAYDATYTSNFYNTVDHPQEMHGVD